MQRHFETKHRFIVLWMALLLAAWTAAAWFIARQHFANELETTVAQEQARATTIAKDVADSLRRNLHFVSGVLNIFKNGPRVWKALEKFGPHVRPSPLPKETLVRQWTRTAEFADLDKQLTMTQSSLGVDAIFVVNAAGDCIASSMGDHAGTPIGTNYADRQWFIDTRNGRLGMQYAMGRTTFVPGLYFAAPITIGGRFRGAVISKIDLSTLAFLVRQADAYVSDTNGVVILAHDPEMLLKSVAGNRLGQMSAQEKLALYRQENFPEIDIKPWNTSRNTPLLQAGNEGFPHVTASVELKEFNLTIHAESDLATYGLLERERHGYFLLLGMLGSAIIVIGAALYFYLQSIRQTRDILEESEERLKLLLASVSHGIWGLNKNGETTFVNRAAASMVGYAPEELIDRSMHDIVHHSHADGSHYPPVDCPMHGTLVDGKAREGVDEVLWRKDGSNFPVDYSAYPMFRHGQLDGAVVVFEDITERKRKEEALRLASSDYQSSMNGILVTDENNLIIDVNPAFTQITGYTLEDVRGKSPSMFKSGKHDPQFYRQMWQSIQDNGCWQGEIWDTLKNGELHAKWLSISVIRHADGRIFRYVGEFSDITEKKQKDDLIWAQANFDTLTNLPNRRLFSDRLRQAMASSARSERHVALLSLDLDQFKRLNDTFGHSMGDKLLVEVANRLNKCVREEDTVARMGGDEFLVLLTGLSADTQASAVQAEVIAEKIRAELCRPYQLDNTEQYTSSSIGIILFLGHSISEEKLLAHVDTAMYQAKAKGRNTICFFDHSMQRVLEKRGQMENALRMALERNEMQLYYQLQMNSKERPIGVEALLRWTNPQLGSVSPAQFIPVAEESGLILPIGHWVLEMACTQLARWQADPVTSRLSIAINVSARQFRETTFVPQVRDALARHGIKPSLLKFELTESLVLDNIDDSVRKIEELKELGIKFAMDDFGTGYSSLSYLSRLPLDQIKIDQSFVRDITADQQDASIVQTIISMAHSLGMEVIAEGVETEEQREFLELRGCTAYQGYLFAKPVTIEELEQKLAALR